MSDKLLYWEYMCTAPWHTYPLSSVQHRSSPSFSELLYEYTNLRKMASSISWGDSGTPTRNPTSEGVPRKFNPHELENFASNDHEGESIAPLIRGEDSLSWLVASAPGFSEAPRRAKGDPDRYTLLIEDWEWVLGRVFDRNPNGCYGAYEHPINGIAVFWRIVLLGATVFSIRISDDRDVSIGSVRRSRRGWV